MTDVRLSRPAGYVLGPRTGVVVLALFALANAGVGVVGAFSRPALGTGRASG